MQEDFFVQWHLDNLQKIKHNILSNFIDQESRRDIYCVYSPAH